MAHTVIWNFDLFCPKFNSMMRGPLQSYAACFAMIAATGFVAFLQNKQTDRHTLPKTLPRRPSPTGRGNSVDGARSKRPLLQAQATLRSGLQIYLRPRVTLTFDLLTPKLIVSCPCPVNHLCQLASKSIRSFTVFRSFVTDGRTDRRTNGHYEPHTDSAIFLFFSTLCSTTQP